MTGICDVDDDGTEGIGGDCGTAIDEVDGTGVGRLSCCVTDDEDISGRGLLKRLPLPFVEILPFITASIKALEAELPTGFGLEGEIEQRVLFAISSKLVGNELPLVMLSVGFGAHKNVGTAAGVIGGGVGPCFASI